MEQDQRPLDDGYFESLLQDSSSQIPPRDYSNFNLYQDEGQIPTPGYDNLGFEQPRSNQSFRTKNSGARQTSGTGVSNITSDTTASEILCNFDLEASDFSPFEQEIIASFLKDGLLSQKTKFFKERKPQIQMVKAVLRALKEHRNLVVEAGTGTGKTFAYLLPLLKLGRQVVVSTRTLNLQDQILKRDIQHLKSMLNNDYNVQVLKGRSNYVCKARLEDYDNKVRSAVVVNKLSLAVIQKIRNFLDQDDSGDLSLMNLNDELRRDTDLIVSHSHTCRGRFCKFREHCYLMQARQRAARADLLVVNHSLLMMNFISNNALFPITPDVVVLDEAHHLPEVVRSSFTLEVGSATVKQINAILDDLMSEVNKYLKSKSNLTALKASRDDDQTASSKKSATKKSKSKGQSNLAVDLKDLSGKVRLLLDKEFAQELYSLCSYHATDRSSDQQYERFSVLLKDLKRASQKTQSRLNYYYDEAKNLLGEFHDLASNYKIPTITDDKKRFEGSEHVIATLYINALEKLESIVDMLHIFCEDLCDNPEQISLVISSKNFYSLQSLSLNISSEFRKTVLNASYGNDEDADMDDERPDKRSNRSSKTDSGEEDDTEAKTPVYIFTSATLSLRNSFKSFTEGLGITDELYLRVSSPFDYASQGFLYLPDFIPGGKTMGFEHVRQVVDYVRPLLRCISGGFLILCTSISVMEQVYNQLRNQPELKGRELFNQNNTSKLNIIKSMISKKNAVTVATSSFWEGVDIPGIGLSCVVIDRLPFRPMDSIQKAVVDYVTKVKKTNAFMEHTLPEMMITLKQGVGRLIRSESDFGVVAIADDRIVGGPSYGRIVLEEIPPFVRSGDLRQIAQQWQLYCQRVASQDAQDLAEQQREEEEALEGLMDPDESSGYTADPEDD